MKRIILLPLLFLAALASQAQLASRVDIALQTAGPTIQVPGSGPLAQVVWLSNASVQVCQHPASIASCTPATTYNDSNEDATCPANLPMVQLPGVTCTASTGVQANIGFWFAGGTIDYIVTSSYGTFGPFTVTQLTGAGAFVQIGNSSLQTMSGPLAAKYFEATTSVPFLVSAASALGYGVNGTNDVDYVSMTNGGALNPAHIWYGVNGGGTAYQKLMSLDNTGNLTPQGDIDLTAGNGYFLGGVTTQGMIDDGAGGINFNATSGATNGFSFFKGASFVGGFDASGNVKNGSGNMVIPAATTGDTGSGNVVLATGPTMTNPIVGTQANIDNSTKAASTAYVNNLIASISAGVTSVNGNGGAVQLTGSVNCAGINPTVCTISATGIANVLLTPFSVATVVNANTCTTATPFTVTGVITSPQSNVWWGWQGNPQNTNGWGKIGGLTLNLFVTGANQVSWSVCNQTAANITSGTPTFIVSAQ